MDLFLPLFIDEFNDLWVNGIHTRDTASDNKVFKIRALLLWMINDFLARISLSGWSEQGYKACPTCNKDTPSMRVVGKTSYVGHQCFLPIMHHWHGNLEFNSKIERRSPPRR